MKTRFIGCKNRFPFEVGCGGYPPPRNNSVHAQQSQFAILTGLVAEQIIADAGIDFTVN
jgi:hypothetical protein